MIFKKSHQSGYKGNKSQHNKSHLWQTHRQHNTQQWKAKSHPSLTSVIRQACPVSPLLFNIVLEVLPTAVRREKDTKCTQITKVKVKVKSLSHVRLFTIPWTVTYQAPQSMGFTRQEYWSGLLFPSPGDLPNPGTEPRSPALQTDALPSEPLGKPPD